MGNTTKKRFDEKKLEQSHSVLRAVAHPLRIEILNFINKKVETNVQSIYHVLDIPQSVTSQQLKILKDTNLVVVRKDKKERFYSINFSLFEKIQNALNSFFID
jgi:DNA-binding transcriptional ArsR family regulator